MARVVGAKKCTVTTIIHTGVDLVGIILIVAMIDIMIDAIGIICTVTIIDTDQAHIGGKTRIDCKFTFAVYFF